jgi:2-dehydropantoate 2-reductase
MKIGIMGAGGIGGYVGGRLAHAGCEVVFIARGGHLTAIQQNGLRVESPAGNIEIKPVQATNDPKEIGAVDLILFCVKSYDVVEAANLIKTMIGPNTAILPVLNGVIHIEQLNELYGAEHVLGGFAVLGANISEPGVIKHYSSNSIIFGEIGGGISSRCDKIEQVMSVPGIEARAVPNIVERMWWKFAMICGFGIFSVMRGDKETIYGFEETRILIHQAITEVVLVAQAKGIPLADSVPDEILSSITDTAPPHTKPSMLVDLERGKRLEIRALNGAVSRFGKQVGILTPVNDFIYACLQPYSDGRP